MADENETSVTSEVVAKDVPVTAAQPKKQRAARRPKAVAEAAASTPAVVAAKVPKTRKKRGEALAAAPAVVDKPVVAKGPAKNSIKAKLVKQAAPAKMSPAKAGDEMADLIQLEEENKKLRKTLAEKLRAENADLRKRLGQG